MFDIGWSEMLIILVVALIVIGPKDLPRVARNVGRWVGKARAMAREFQTQLEDMAREAELDKVKEEIEKVGRTDIKRSIQKTIDPDDEMRHALDPNADRKSSPKSAARSARKLAPGKAAPDEVAVPQDEGAASDEVAARAKAQEQVAEPHAGPAANAAKPSPQVTTERERVPAETN